jgi:hypothetical protein
MVFNATFNNISVISYVSFIEEETGALEENHRPVVRHWQTLSHNVVSSTPCHVQGSKSNYHTIMTTTTPIFVELYNILIMTRFIQLLKFDLYFPDWKEMFDLILLSKI